LQNKLPLYDLFSGNDYSTDWNYLVRLLLFWWVFQLLGNFVVYDLFVYSTSSISGHDYIVGDHDDLEDFLLSVNHVSACHTLSFTKWLAPKLLLHLLYKVQTEVVLAKPAQQWLVFFFFDG
jgi:hypothetical protein